ncbi:kinase-like domain-containing protein [Rhizophagus clarus]|uniref:Kinase-like domain-containing protein n=1 Tax=Rhizophagus clarus TaxID=94130 RepID=A0A8H3LV34_9GLOM|nr:kinase-like domain-containing protein [Rhizophagus clarus]
MEEIHKWNSINWPESGNVKIDGFIQEIQLKFNSTLDIKFQCIPYDQFRHIKKIGDSEFTLATCNDIKINLKYLYNSQNITTYELHNEVGQYLISYGNIRKIYGISQNPDTKDYILVLQDGYCEKCDEKYTKRIFEWIPYDQFDSIKKIGNTICSALWKEGPLEYDWNKQEWTRAQACKKVNLKLCNSRNVINEFLNKVKVYENDFIIYGISQNQDTGDYFIVLEEICTEYEVRCNNCHEKYMEIEYKWCKACQIKNLSENFRNWASGSEKIDNFIQEMQLKINNPKDIIFEWISYNQFNNIKRIRSRIFSAEFENIIDEFLNNKELKIYGITQDPDTNNYFLVIQDGYCEGCGGIYTEMKYKWCKPCQIKLKNWDSGNKIINNLIQSMQSYINGQNDIIFEWILYDQLSNIEKIGNNSGFAIATWKSNMVINLKYLPNPQNMQNIITRVKQYSTRYHDNIRKIYGVSQNPDTKDYILVLQDGYCEECDKKYTETLWEDGPIIYDLNKRKWARAQAKEITLKCLRNSQNIVDEFLNMVKKYDEISKIYGISQNPNTKDYIIILRNKYDERCCEECIEQYTEKEYKCNIKEIGNTLYSALWKDGPLKYDQNKREWATTQVKEISKIYGISQDPDTKDYIMVSQKEYDGRFCEECIEKYTEIKNKWYMVFEWISYDQFNGIKEIGKTVYSALWKDGPLRFDSNERKWIKVQAKEVTLKICNSYSTVNDFLSKVKIYNNVFKLYGITQNPDSKDYVIVLENYHKEYFEIYCEMCLEDYTDIKYKWCKPCQVYNLRKNFTNWSGNEKIDEFIQEMQLKINNPNDMVFEWIPHNQFKVIKKVGKGGFATVNLAKWKNGPLHYDGEWKRGPYKKVALKILNKSQDMTDEFIKEIKAYSMNKCGSNIIKIFGISQDPITKYYVIVLQYAEGGNFNDWMRNILFKYGCVNQYNDTYISDMGLCGEIGNVDESKIYGVMSYVAPEVFRGKLYTKAADIYSFGMIMYFVATGRQPFGDRAHDKLLVLDICNHEIRPEINESEAPNCYIELMKRCWNSVPDNRPDAIEIEHIIYSYNFNLNNEIEKQFKEAEEYRKANVSSIDIIRSTSHPQAFNISRLLNPYTEDLLECDNTDNPSGCLDCVIMD